MTDDVVLRARSLVGCRFRPQGRDPEHGLDCVGVVCAAFGIPADSVPRNYRLRDGGLERVKLELSRFFRLVRTPAAGDVLIFEVAAVQLHLGILTDLGLIHADALLRKVVESPGRPPWEPISAYRRKGA
jgi:hypothetical protein